MSLQAVTGGVSQVIDAFPMDAALHAVGCNASKASGRIDCPFKRHQSRYAFSYNVERGVWSCHACNLSGGKIALVMRLFSINKKAALAWMADYVGVELREWSAAERAEYTSRIHAASDFAAQASDWIRGLTLFVEERKRHLVIAWNFASENSLHELELMIEGELDRLPRPALMSDPLAIARAYRQAVQDHPDSARSVQQLGREDRLHGNLIATEVVAMLADARFTSIQWRGTAA